MIVNTNIIIEYYTFYTLKVYFAILARKLLLNFHCCCLSKSSKIAQNYIILKVPL